MNSIIIIITTKNCFKIKKDNFTLNMTTNNIVTLHLSFCFIDSRSFVKRYNYIVYIFRILNGLCSETNVTLKMQQKIKNSVLIAFNPYACPYVNIQFRKFKF